MGKLKQFEIKFSGDKQIYFPGDKLSGEVIVDLESSMEMTAIKLKFIGRAHVHWSETHGSGDNQHTVHYHGNQELFKEKIKLFGNKDKSKSELKRGTHSFPFEYQLPDKLPSSYEDSIGHVRYVAKCTIDRPWRFDHNTKRAFTVLEMVDLNSFAEAQNPSEASDSKVLCCWCCKSDPIEAECRTDRTGYVPGEWIGLDATFTNKSNSKVKKTSATLVKSVTYHATAKSKTSHYPMAYIEGKKCKKDSVRTWEDMRLQIPALPPTLTTSCKVLTIEYFVVFRAHLRTFAIDLRAPAPIVLGTVPLRTLEMYQNRERNEQQEIPQQEGFVNQAFSGSQSEAFSPPPPTYVAPNEGGVSIKDDDDNMYTMGDMTYSPQYTYYDWKEQAFTYNK